MIAALSDAGAAMGRRTTWTPRAPAPASCSTRCATRRVGCSDLEGGQRQAERLPGGPCVPRGGAPPPLRGHPGSSLVRCRARDRRRDDRALRRSESRRVLHDLARSRGTDRPPQGRRRSSDPIWELIRSLRPPAACGAHRGAELRGAGRGRDAPVLPGGRPPSRRLRTPASGDRLPPLPVREVALVAPATDGSTPLAELAGVVRSAIAPMSSLPAARRAPSAPSCSGSGPRWRPPCRLRL